MPLRRAFLTGRPERDRDGKVVGAAHDAQGQGLAVAQAVQRLVEVVDPGYGPARRLDDEVPLAQAGPARGAVLLDGAYKQAVAVGQPDRAAQLARRPGW